LKISLERAPSERLPCGPAELAVDHFIKAREANLANRGVGRVGGSGGPDRSARTLVKESFAPTVRNNLPRVITTVVCVE
jgi:hypothetical protein